MGFTIKERTMAIIVLVQLCSPSCVGVLVQLCSPNCVGVLVQLCSPSCVGCSH